MNWWFFFPFFILFLFGPPWGVGSTLDCGSYEAHQKIRHINPYPRWSMYGIFTYIWVTYGVNVGEYTIHGSSGYNSLGESQFFRGIQVFFPGQTVGHIHISAGHRLQGPGDGPGLRCLHCGEKFSSRAWDGLFGKSTSHPWDLEKLDGTWDFYGFFMIFRIRGPIFDPGWVVFWKICDSSMRII